MSNIEITALKSVPEPAKGLVRDIRVRWALEEAGLPYAVRKLDMRMDLRDDRPADYLAESPFGQVPAYRDGDVAMFESGAIALHIGETNEALMPRDPQGRARAKSWVLAALNNVEPATWNYAMLRVFYGGQDWAEQARPIFEETARKRLEPVAAYLGDNDWLEGRFTAGDLLMVCGSQDRRPHGSAGRFPDARRLPGAWRGAPGLPARAGGSTRRLREPAGHRLRIAPCSHSTATRSRPTHGKR
ncbi:MAG: glutathione S-transferase family protein [Croceibacterium sp.]